VARIVLPSGPRLRGGGSRLSSFFLQVSFQIGQTDLPERPIALDPSEHLLQGYWLELVQSLATSTLFTHQPRMAKHAEMFRNRRSALGELPCRKIAFKKHVRGGVLQTLKG
jgi:hypothetical protein